jgi:hypothetical protein
MEAVLDLNKIDAVNNLKLSSLVEFVKTSLRMQSESEYTVYADHSDYCIGLFDNG